MNNKIILFFLIVVLSGTVYALVGYSESPTNEWWMAGGNASFHRFAVANSPANISNTNVTIKIFSESISASPIVAGESLYLIPVLYSSSRAYELNASNISMQIHNSSSSTYSHQGTSPTYYANSLFFHSDGNLYQINATNLSQIIDTENIADGIYYGVPVIYNYSLFIGDGNAAPRFKEFNASNISQLIRSFTTTGRIYESAPFAGPYVYVAETSQLRQLNASNISQIINSVACSANGISYLFPATKDFVYKACTVNSVNILQQYNATNITRVYANFTNATSNSVLGNGFVYFGLGNRVYQLNASNVSQQIATYTTNGSISSSLYPVLNRNYLFIAAGNIMYQLDAYNISRLIGNYTAAATISGSPILAKGFLYFGAGTRLYQLGNRNLMDDVDTTPPVVTLSNPGAGYYNDTANPYNVSFSCSVTDDIQLSNVSLYITNHQNSSFGLNFTSSVSSSSSSGNWNIGLQNGNYTWNCFAVDSSGNSAFGNNNRSIVINFTDADGDGLGDGQDKLMGNSSSPQTSGISLLNITVDGGNTNGIFSGLKELVFYDTNDKIINFSFNFSAGTLYLDRINIVKTSTYLIVNLSGQLQTPYNKTLYIEDDSFDSLCARDEEISSISDMSSACTGSYETDLTICIGNSTLGYYGNLSCFDSGSFLAIGNLRYSALRGGYDAETQEINQPEENETESGGRGSNYISEIGSYVDTLRLKMYIAGGQTVSKTVLENKGTEIKEFEIKAKDWITGEVNIKAYDSVPEGCEINYQNYYQLYKAIDINHTFNNDKIESARLRVKINKEWIRNHGISEIVVVRCNPDYQELVSSYVDETDSSGIYDVYSKGFSTWAVLGTIEDVQEAPLIEDSKVHWILLIVIIILLGLILIIKALRDRKASIQEGLHLHTKMFDLDWAFKIKFNRPPHEKRFPAHK